MDDEEYYQLQVSGSSWTHLAPQYRQRLFEAIDSLGELKGKSVFDVGCGDGESVWYMYEKGAYANGLEYSEDKVLYAKEKGLDVYKYDIDKSETYMPPAEIVFCSHTLEHTRDAVQSTKNLCRLVDVGGKLLIIVPHEEEFPIENPSHTQWMSNERIQKVKEVLEQYFTMVKEERKHRVENEVWLIAEGKKA